MKPGRREFLSGSGAVMGLAALGGCAPLMQSGPADVVIVNGRVATLNPRQPDAAAIAIRGDTIVGVGSEAELNSFRDEKTRVIDAGRRTVIPGLNDAHTHFIRGGLTYTNEVRWDGVPSLAEGMRRVGEQARRTPPPHWVQVIGGWTWAQFAEKRFPTLEEINAATGKLAADRLWTLRIGYELFAQAPGKELDNYLAWSKLVSIGEGNDYYRMIGAGEYVLYAAGDPANFAKDWVVAPPGVMESQFTAVTKHLVGLRWPFRQHTTFDSTASRVLNVLEQVNRDVPLKGLRWGLDHCETLSPKTLERVARLGGSINIQNRLSLDGEAFLSKYGAQAAADAPPVARIREMGIPLACGTDANRATSYNPWIGVNWLITGKTLGGAKLQGERNLLDRTAALRLYTSGGAWMSSEEDRKGTLEIGKLADVVILSADYFSVPEEGIKDIESVLTMVGGKPVYGAGPYARLDPPSLPTLPDWLPVRHYGGYDKRSVATAATFAAHKHPSIVSDGGVWSTECPCGAF